VPATTGTVVEAGAAPDVHAAVPLVGAAAVGVAAGVLLPAQPAIAAASAMAANAPMVTRERGDPIIACVPSATALPAKPEGGPNLSRALAVPLNPDTPDELGVAIGGARKAAILSSGDCG